MFDFYSNFPLDLFHEKYLMLLEERNFEVVFIAVNFQFPKIRIDKIYNEKYDFLSPCRRSRIISIETA